MNDLRIKVFAIRSIFRLEKEGSLYLRDLRIFFSIGGFDFFKNFVYVLIDFRLK